MYFNGELIGQGATTSRTLALSGSLNFGHERHFVGSNREVTEIFGGELFKAKVFVKELTGKEILGMKKAGLCSDVEESPISPTGGHTPGAEKREHHRSGSWMSCSELSRKEGGGDYKRDGETYTRIT